MPKAQARRKVGKLDFIKIKNCCELEDAIKKVKRQTAEWKKTLADRGSGKGLDSGIERLLITSHQRTKPN